MLKLNQILTTRGFIKEPGIDKWSRGDTTITRYTSCGTRYVSIHKSNPQKLDVKHYKANDPKLRQMLLDMHPDIHVQLDGHLNVSAKDVATEAALAFRQYRRELAADCDRHLDASNALSIGFNKQIYTIPLHDLTVIDMAAAFLIALSDVCKEAPKCCNYKR